MKKALILFTALILLTGCGTKKEKNTSISCSFKNTDEGAEFTTNVDISIEDDIVKSATYTMDFKDESLSTFMCNIAKQTTNVNSEDLVCSDKSIVINNYQKTVSEDKMTKDDFIKHLEDQKFVCE